jgi:hypothetical protein
MLNQNKLTFHAPTTFVNISSDEKRDFLKAARDHFANVQDTLDFYIENGTEKDCNEYADMTRKELIEEFYGDRSEVREVEQILETFDDIGSFYEYGLSFDFVDADENSDGYYRFQICWGGPSSEVRFYPDGTIEAVYLDWFIGVGFDVTNKAEFQWLESTFKDTCMIDFDSKDLEEIDSEYYKEINGFYDEEEEENDD